MKPGAQTLMRRVNRLLASYSFTFTVGLLTALAVLVAVLVVWVMNVLVFQKPDPIVIAETILSTTLISLPLIALSVSALRQTRRSAKELSAALKRSEHLLEEALHAKSVSERAIADKSKLLSNVSHELRSPLHAIVAYAELLLEVAKERNLEDMASDAKKIQIASRHLTDLVERVLNLSTIESNAEPIESKRFRLVEFMEELMAICRPLAEKEQLDLELVMQPDIGEVVSDPLMLRQVIINLVANAAKFADKGGIAVDVRRRPGQRLGEGGDIVLFSVSDQGSGIAEEDLSTIFEPFSRTSKAIGVAGSGLGLAIVRAHARRLGGEISVSSEPGVGSTFTLVIPAELERVG